jgi:glucokinase
MNVYIIVDIGGTQIRVGIYPEEGLEPLRLEKIATQGEGKPLDRLIKLVAQTFPSEHTVRSMVVAAPGAIDPHRGIMVSAPNIPGFVNLPLRKVLVDQFNVPVSINNDANMAAMGEWCFGAGQGHHNLIYMTISTGIGGGVIIDDRLLVGERSLATEMGHITVLPDGPRCGCGQRGHLESISSGTGIANYFAEQVALGVPSVLSSAPNPSTREIAEAAKEGDALSIQAIRRGATFLGVAIADYLHLFNPSIVILGGGVTKSGPLFWDTLKENLAKHLCSQEYLAGFDIKPAALGDEVGLLGALGLARMQYHTNHLILS